MMKKGLLLLLCVCATAMISRAQTLTISADPAAPDTVWHNASELFPFQIGNPDTVAVSMTVDVVVAHDMGTITPYDTVSLVSVMLDSAEVMGAFTTIDFTSANTYEPGDRNVTMWLLDTSGAVISDTMSHPVHILGATDSLGCFVVNGAYYEPVVWKNFNEYAYALRNTGSTTFDATVDMHFAVEGPGIFTEISMVPDISVPELSPGEDFTGSNFLTYSQIAAVPGGNGIVIWPEAPNDPTIITTDSARITYLLAPTGIVPAHLEQLELYPNPAQDFTRLYLNGQPLVAKTIRVTDSNGRLVEVLQNVGEIDLSRQNRGIYFVEVELNNGDKKSFKAMRF